MAQLSARLEEEMSTPPIEFSQETGKDKNATTMQ